MSNYELLIDNQREKIEWIKENISLTFLDNLKKEIDQTKDLVKTWVQELLENKKLRYVNISTLSNIFTFRERNLNLIVDIYINKWPVIVNDVIIKEENIELWRIQWVKTSLKNTWWHCLYPWKQHKPVEVNYKYRWEKIWPLLYTIHNELFSSLDKELTDTNKWIEHFKMLLWLWYYPVEIALSKNKSLYKNEESFQEYIENIIWIKETIDLDRWWYIIIFKKINNNN